MSEHVCKPSCHNPCLLDEGVKVWHMYVWTKQPFFHAVAQAVNVAEARTLLLEEIGGGDGSCPEREAAAKWVREQQPNIFHRSNAEFSLTDSAELREQETHSEMLNKRLEAAQGRIGELDRLLKFVAGDLLKHINGEEYERSLAGLYALLTEGDEING